MKAGVTTCSKAVTNEEKEPPGSQNASKAVEEEQLDTAPLEYERSAIPQIASGDSS